MEWTSAKREVKSFSHETTDNINVSFLAVLANRKYEQGLHTTMEFKTHARHKFASCTEGICAVVTRRSSLQYTARPSVSNVD